MMETVMVKTLDEYFTLEERGKIYRGALNRLERVLIEKALEHSRGNQIMASKMLGLNRNTLRKKIRLLNIQPLKFKS